MLTPKYLVAPDEVVRLAGQVEVADGRRERHLAVLLCESPKSKFERSDDLVPTSTAAEVRRGPILLGNVEDSRFYDFWNTFYELWF